MAQGHGYAYDLTKYTRTANEDRRAAWNGFEVKRRYIKIGSLSAFISLLLSTFGFAMFGPSGGVIMFLVLFPLPFLLVEGRSNEGMRLRHYQSFWDKKVTGHTGQFVLCNRIIEPDTLRTGIIKSSSMPVDRQALTHRRANLEQATNDLFTPAI